MSILQVCTLLFLYGILLFSSVQDFRTLTVKNLYSMLFILGNLFLACVMNRGMIMMLSGLLPAIVILFWNCFISQQVGLADIYFLIGAGIGLGVFRSLLLLTGGLFLASVYGLIVMKRSGRHMNCEIPLIPFLSIFYVLQTLL